MGVVDQFNWAVDLMEEKLRFRLSGDATEFRLVLDRAGKKRFEHAVELVRLWARPDYKGASKYNRLMYILKLITPQKVGKYRNAAVGAAVAAQEALDEELRDKLERGGASRSYKDFSKQGHWGQFVKKSRIKNRAALGIMRDKFLFDDEAILKNLLHSHREYYLPCPRCFRTDKRRFKQISTRPRTFSCVCGWQISPTAGTIFGKSTTSLSRWFKAQSALEASDYEVSAAELARMLFVTYKTAWRMKHLLSGHKLEGKRLSPGYTQVSAR